MPNPTVSGIEDCLYLYVYRPKVRKVLIEEYKMSSDTPTASLTCIDNLLYSYAKSRHTKVKVFDYKAPTFVQRVPKRFAEEKSFCIWVTLILVCDLYL